MIEPSFSGEVVSFLVEQDDKNDEFKSLILAAECLLEIRKKSSLLLIDSIFFQKFRNLIQYKSECEIQEIKLRKKELPSYPQVMLDGLHLYPNQYDKSDSLISLIVKIWPNEPNTLALLKNCVRPGNFWTLQYTALEELAQRWRDDPDTLPTIKMWIQVATQGNVLETALRELARGWRDDPITFSTLKAHALSGKDGGGRKQAIQELARGWQDTPETLLILKGCIQDKEHFIRNTAIRELGKTFREQLEVFEILYNCALHDSFERKEDWETNPRQTALESIVANYSASRQILDLLNDRGTNDPDEQVREFAEQQLAKLEH